MAAFDVEEYNQFIQGLENTWDPVKGLSTPGGGAGILSNVIDGDNLFPSDSAKETARIFFRNLFSGLEWDATGSFDDFLTALSSQSYLGGTSGITKEEVREKFAIIYQVAVGLDIESGTPNTSQYADLYQGLISNPEIASDPALVAKYGLTDINTFIQKNIDNFYDYFLSHFNFTIPRDPIGEDADGNVLYLYDNNGQLRDSFSDVVTFYPGVEREWDAIFFNALGSFLTSRSKIDSSALITQGNSRFEPGPATISSYENLYFAALPDATQADYQLALSKLYKEVVDRDGYFNPSHHLDDWAALVETERTAKLG